MATVIIYSVLVLLNTVGIFHKKNKNRIFSMLVSITMILVAIFLVNWKNLP